MLFTPQLFVNHRGQNTSGLSPRLWAKVYGNMMAADGSARLNFIADDFMSFKGAGTYLTPIGEAGGYTAYIDTSNTIVGLADEVGGVVALTNAATDNNETWLQLGDATTTVGAISDTAGSDFLTAFECRVKKGSIADNVSAIFCGLAQEGCAAANSKVDDTGVMADKDYIGFDSVHAAGETINFVYKMAGETAITKISGVHTAVADDFVKLGFIYDPQAKASERIKVFVNNVEQSTYVSASDIASTTNIFPDGEEMSPLFGIKQGSAAAGELAIDWWAYAQLIKPATN